MPMSLKKNAPLVAGAAGGVMGATGLVPIVWWASISLVLLGAIAVGMWRRDWLKWKQRKEKRDPGSSPG